MAKKKRHPKSNPAYELAQSEFEDKLDFHDFGILDAFEIESILNEFIEDAYHSGFRKVLVVTGKGAVIRPMAPKLLKKNQYVENFTQAGYFTGQSGAFEVTLKQS